MINFSTKFSVNPVKSLVLFATTFLILMASETNTFAQLGVNRIAMMRPYGPNTIPDPLRIFIPQGFGKADFRPACRVHDDCHSIAGQSKSQCDLHFFGEMVGACSNSRFPILCARRAKRYYNLVHRFGDDAYQLLQDEIYDQNASQCNRAVRR